MHVFGEARLVNLSGDIRKKAHAKRLPYETTKVLCLGQDFSSGSECRRYAMRHWIVTAVREASDTWNCRQIGANANGARLIKGL